MTDYYLQDKSRLNGQPKRTIGDYVESQGIPVPRRFDTLNEARTSGLPILCRSEDAQEYEGVSGLIFSPRLEKYADARNILELVQMITKEEEVFAQKAGIETNLQMYSGLTGVPIDTLKAELRFSFWHHLPGQRRVVTADSAIARKYHVFTKDYHGSNYCIIDSGRIISPSINLNATLQTHLKQGVPQLIELYEKIRNLPHFDSFHCPIMEFVTSNGKDYFLQYHRGRDFHSADFCLEKSKHKTEIKAIAVRGITPSSGMTIPLTVQYSANTLGLPPSHWSLSNSEMGSCDFHSNGLFSELMVRRRKLQWVDTPTRARFWGAAAQSIDHLYLSKYFKPQVTLFADLSAIVSEDERQRLLQDARITSTNQFITVHVVSDGCKAYLRRIA